MNEGFSKKSLGGILVDPGMLSRSMSKSSGRRTSNNKTSRLAFIKVWSASGVMLCDSRSRFSLLRLIQKQIRTNDIATHTAISTFMKLFSPLFHRACRRASPVLISRVGHPFLFSSLGANRDIEFADAIGQGG